MNEDTGKKDAVLVIPKFLCTHGAIYLQFSMHTISMLPQFRNQFLLDQRVDLTVNIVTAALVPNLYQIN